jgi:hypothetical protein
VPFCQQSQNEPAVRQFLEAPGAVRCDRRAARERDRDRGGERYPARRLRRQSHDDIWVFLGLLGNDPVIAEALGETRILADSDDVERRRARAQPRIEVAQRQQRLDFHANRSAI